MTKVIIVSKTHMHNNMACIGGFDIDKKTSLRLLSNDKTNFPVTTDFEVGQIWEINYRLSNNIEPPHVEDVVVVNRKLIKTQNKVGDFIRQQGIVIWPGSPRNLFDGKTRFTAKNSAYISKFGPLPKSSTGYWLPDCDLCIDHDAQRNKTHYYTAQIRAPFVGFQTIVNVIPAGTLVRVSLARWWKPWDAAEDIEERCYVQISGWYT